MKVLYVHDRPSGGAGESLYQIITSRPEGSKSSIIFGGTGFLRKRFKLLGLSPPPVYKTSHSWLARRYENNNFLSLLWRILVLPLHLPFLFSILKVAREQKVQLIHSNCLYLFEGALAAKILRLPHVWQVRELVDLDYYQYAFPKRFVINCIVNKFSTIILANSKRTAEGLAQLGVATSKTKIIYNIVVSPTRSANLRKKIGIDKEPILVGILGWITPNKKVEDFIKVASLLKDLKNVKFLIIGGWGGVTDYNEKIKKAIEHSPNNKNIICTGIIENAPQFLSSLSVLLCPCFTESFGRTVAEAMAVGTPAIGIKGSAVEEIIDHGETGYLVDKGDAEAMAKHTRRLLETPSQGIAFGRLGKQRVLSRFGKNIIATDLEKIYKSCSSLPSR